MQEQDPKIFNDFAKIKKIGKEKKSLQNVIDKINFSKRKLDDLKVLYDMLVMENASDGEWKDFDNEYKETEDAIENL